MVAAGVTCIISENFPVPPSHFPIHVYKADMITHPISAPPYVMMIEMMTMAKTGKPLNQPVVAMAIEPELIAPNKKMRKPYPIDFFSSMYCSVSVGRLQMVSNGFNFIPPLLLMYMTNLYFLSYWNLFGVSLQIKKIPLHHPERDLILFL